MNGIFTYSKLDNCKTIVKTIDESNNVKQYRNVTIYSRQQKKYLKLRMFLLLLRFY